MLKLINGKIEETEKERRNSKLGLTTVSPLLGAGELLQIQKAPGKPGAFY